MEKEVAVTMTTASLSISPEQLYLDAVAQQQAVPIMTQHDDQLSIAARTSGLTEDQNNIVNNASLVAENTAESSNIQPVQIITNQGTVNMATLPQESSYHSDVMGSQASVIVQVAGADGNPMYLSLPQGYLLSGSTNAVSNSPNVGDSGVEIKIVRSENEVTEEQQYQQLHEEDKSITDTEIQEVLKEEDEFRLPVPPYPGKNPKIFSEVAATISKEITNHLLLNGPVTQFLETLAESHNLSLKTKNDQYLLLGEIERLLKIEKYLSLLLDVTQPRRTVNKAVNCCMNEPVYSRSGRLIKRKLTEDLVEVEEEENKLEDVYMPSRINYLNNPKRRRKTQPRKRKECVVVTEEELDEGTPEELKETLYTVREDEIWQKDEAKDEENIEDLKEPDIVKEPSEITENDDPESVEYIEDDCAPNISKEKRQAYEANMPYKFFCDLCSFKTKRKSHLLRHEDYHNRLEILKCTQCDYRTLSHGHLQRHQVIHTKQPFQCRKCPFKAAKRALLKRHVKVHHTGAAKNLVVKARRPRSTNKHSCPHCSYSTCKELYYKRHLSSHIQMAFEMKQDQIVITQELVDDYKCQNCAYTTKNKDRFMRHMMSVHLNSRPFLCDICGFAFKRKDALKQHHFTHEDKDIRQQAMKFECKTCKKRLRSKAHLKEHQTIHSLEKPYLCEICGASFKSHSAQKKHVRSIHNNPGAFLCSQCPKRFNTKYALIRHRKSHDAKTTDTEPTKLTAIELDTERVQVVHIPSQDMQEMSLVDYVKEDELTGSHVVHEIIQAPSSSIGTALQDAADLTQATADLSQAQAAYVQTNDTSTALLYLTQEFQ